MVPKNEKLICALVILVFLGIFRPAIAAPILDQNNGSLGEVEFCGFWNPGQCHWLQGVTAGLNGTLAGVTLWTIGSSTLTIYSGTPGSLGTALYTTSFSGGSSVFIDTSSANIALVVGQQFVLDVFGFDLVLGNVTPYNGGALWVNAPFAYRNNNTYSLGFQTFMQTESGVPAPGAITLLGFGLVGLGRLRRKLKAA